MIYFGRAGIFRRLAAKEATGMGLLELRQQTASRVRRIPTELIDPNPAQPRQSFDSGEMAGLALSIKESGLLTPISVRKTGGRYQLIAGERRLMAFKLLGEKKIPAIIQEADDKSSAVLALVENLQRSDLDFYEQARAISALIESLGLTQQQAAQRLGLSQPAVANKLRLLKLPQWAVKRLVEAGLSERHARALLPLADDSRLEALLERVISEQMTVARLERLIAAISEHKQPQPRGGRLLIVKDLKIFNTAIERAVDMMKQAGVEAVSRKTEDERAITYTVVIPKASAKNKRLQDDRTPVKRP